MNVRKGLYETVFVLHPELTEEDVEANIQSTIQLLEGKGSEIIRIDRGGKRRLAYVMRKQRYGYYNLIHFRGTPEALTELERIYRLSERVLRYLTVRFEKEEHLTGFTRVPDDDGREEDRDERRRGGRRGDGFHGRGEGRFGRRDGIRGGGFDAERSSPMSDDSGLDDDDDVEDDE
ncbi:MAG: 30S ribosomal protein S6 [Candidatus Tectimicrobiota bacterium]